MKLLKVDWNFLTQVLGFLPCSTATLLDFDKSLCDVLVGFRLVFF